MAVRRLVPLLMAAALLAGCLPEKKAIGTLPAPTASPGDNGVAALPAKEILRRAVTALNTASSYRVKGAVREGKRRYVIDLKVLRDDVRGTITMGRAKMEIIEVDGQQFARGNRAFWVEAVGSDEVDAAMRLVGKKWLRVRAAGDDFFEDLFDVKDIDFLALGPMVKGEPKIVSGVPTIPLVGATTVTYVALNGTPYPVLAQSTDKEQLVFSEFSVLFRDVVAPKPGNIVDIPNQGA